MKSMLDVVATWSGGDKGNPQLFAVSVADNDNVPGNMQVSLSKDDQGNGSLVVTNPGEDNTTSVMKIALGDVSKSDPAMFEQGFFSGQTFNNVLVAMDGPQGGFTLTPKEDFTKTYFIRDRKIQEKA